MFGTRMYSAPACLRPATTVICDVTAAPMMAGVCDGLATAANRSLGPPQTVYSARASALPPVVPRYEANWVVSAGTGTVIGPKACEPSVPVRAPPTA